MKDARCRDCGRPIRFAGTSNGGKVPLDPTPHPHGSVALDEHGNLGPNPEQPGTPDLTARYLPHRLACNPKE